MSILTYRPKELATQRKLTSDIKNNTDNLTFAESKNDNARAAAYHESSNLLADLNIKALERQTAEDYFGEYNLEH